MSASSAPTRTQAESDQFDRLADEAAAHVGATFLLGRRRLQYPTAARLLAQANIRLAAAIIAFDEVNERIEAGEKIHSLAEQAEIEAAQAAYGQALADMLRGEQPDGSPAKQERLP